MNIWFWCENPPAGPWTASVWWMMPEMEEDVFIFSWLCRCMADWNGLAIVYKLLWSDPSLWTGLSQPWPLRPLSHWPEAAVYTVCHVDVIKATSPKSNQCFTPLSCLFPFICRLSITVVIFLLLPVIFSPAISDLLSYTEFCTSVLCCCFPQKAKEQFHCSMPQFLCPSRVNWVRSSRGCWCVSELRKESDLLLDGLICCSYSEVLVA